MNLEVEAHLLDARRQATRLLQRAEHPRMLRLGTIAALAALLFVASLAGGFAMRIADIAAVDRGEPMQDLLARQHARQQWRWGGLERATPAASAPVTASTAMQ